VSTIQYIASLSFAVLLAACSPPSQAPSQDSPLASDSPTGSSGTLAEISEERAFTLLTAALKEQQVDLECLSFMTESDLPADAKSASWVMTARESHRDGCGGDPDTSPMRDRYEVRSNGEVLVYDFSNDEYVEM